MFGKTVLKKGENAVLLGPLGHRAYSLDKDRVYVTSEVDGKGTVLSSQLYEVFRQIKGFKTPARHAEALLKDSTIAFGRRFSTSQIVEAVRALKGYGLLISQNTLLEELSHPLNHSSEHSPDSPAVRSNADLTPDSITNLVWPSRQRPVALLRSLSTALRNAEMYGRKMRYQVHEDGKAPDPVVEAKLRRFADRAGVSIEYSDGGDRGKYITSFSSYAQLDGSERELLEYALFGEGAIENTNGANRNAVLLSTAGSMALSADDDTIFRFVRRSTGGGGADNNPHLKIRERERFVSADFYSHIFEALSSVAYEDVDIIGEHEKYLGKTVPEIIGDYVNRNGQEGLDLSELDHSMPSLFTIRDDKRVLLSIPGLIGDSGRANNHLFFTEMLSDTSIFEADRSTLYSLLRSRALHRFTENPIMSSDGHFMATHFAMDNRRLLPPFFPMGSGVDSSYMSIIHYVYNGTPISYLPREFIHAPPEPRAVYDSGADSFRARVNDHLGRIVDHLRRKTALFSFSPSERMVMLGKELIDLSQASAKELSCFLRDLTEMHYSQYAQYIEEMYSLTPSLPQHLEEAYRFHIDALHEYLVTPEAAEPADLVSPNERKTALFGEMLAAYGRLLCLWPHFFESARRASHDGLCMTRSINPE